MIRALSFLLLSGALAAASLACGGAGDDTASGGQDIVASPSPPSSSSNGDAKVLVSCTDKKDPKATALLTVDSAFRFTWQIRDKKVTSTLVGVDQAFKLDDWTFHDAAGNGVQVTIDAMGAENVSIFFGQTVSVECVTAKAKIDHAAIATLLDASKASHAKAQTLATCPAGPHEDPMVFTFRPPLVGKGAVIEATPVGNETIMFLAQSVTKADSVTFKGQGGAATFDFFQGEKVVGLDSLTIATGEFASLSFNGASDGPDFFNGCNVTGQSALEDVLKR